MNEHTFFNAQIALPIVQSIAIVAGFLWLGNKSYRTKKGENKAIEEDIEKITRLVEGVKKDLTDKTEELKSKIAYENEHKITMRSLEREAILALHNSMSTYINAVLRIDLSGYEIGGDTLVNPDFELKTPEMEFTYAQNNLAFYFDEDAFRKALLDVKLSIYDLIGYTKEINTDFKLMQSTSKIKLNGIQSGDERVSFFKEAGEAHLEQYKLFLNRKTEYFQKILTTSQVVKEMLKQRMVELT